MLVPAAEACVLAALQKGPETGTAAAATESMVESRPVLDTEALLAHAGWVRAVAHSLLADPDSAEDLAQDTFLAALERQPEQVTSVSGWLGGVLRHMAARSHRGDVRRLRREGRAARSGECPSAAELAEHAVTLREVVQAVIELEEPYRSTVMLRYFEDLTPTMIARELGLPAATVRTRLHRAHALLRQRLEIQFGREETRKRLSAVALAPPGWLATLLKSGVLAGPAVKTGLAAGVLVVFGIVWWERHTAPASAPAAPLQGAALVAEEPAPGAEEVGSSSAQRLNMRAAAPVSAPAAAPATATLRIQVLWEGTGEPVPGVPLALFWTALRESSIERTAGVSDHEGRWNLELSAPAEVHSLWASATAVTPGHFQMEFEDLSPGAVQDLLLRLPRPGVLEGVVQDLEGRPVPGAEVLGWMAVARPDWLEDRADRRTVADAEGRFRLEGLAGEFWLAARAGELLPTRSIEGRLESGASLSGLELSVEAPRALAGRVRTAQGEAVANAKIEAVSAFERRDPEQAGDGYQWRSRGTPAFHVRTDADGRFALSMPASRKVTLSVRGTSIRLAPDQHWADIVLEDGVTLSGQVLDLEGAAVAGAHVQLFPHARGSWPPMARTDAAGNFTLHLQDAPDSGTLSVRRDGYAPVVLESVPLEPAAAPLQVRLAPERVLAGKVVDAAGAPAGFARLRLDVASPADSAGNPWLAGASGMFGFEDMKTDEAGLFRIGGLQDAVYRLWVVPLGSKHPQAFTEVHAGAEDLHIVLGDGLERLLTVRGRVTDARGGTPVPRFTVMVELRRSWGAFEEFQDSEGFFTLPGQDPERVRSITVSAEGYAEWRRDVDTAAAGFLDLEVQLLAERSARVRVLSPAGAPLAAAEVAARDADGRTLRLRVPDVFGWGTSVDTDAQGEALLRGLPDAVVTLLVSPPDGGPPLEFPLDLTLPLEGIQELRL
ncbi:MAG: sigma-70 family RNA polymerase sigma factor [Planctomycetota bacterium]|nr:MAG: sigma-70 family RNA polymerase sigma factor [Planctomycetota bacterium]